MATPVYCCGFECGAIPSSGGSAATEHLLKVDVGLSFSTSTFRSPGLRALRSNPTAATQAGRVTVSDGTPLTLVSRFYVGFAVLPSADCTIYTHPGILPPSGPSVRFKQSDSKLYAAVGTTFGATGVAVTTGVWYRIDFKSVIGAGSNDTADVQVDGVVCGQATAAGAGGGSGQIYIGCCDVVNADVFFDDHIISLTGADYPFGGGYVLSYIPNADGAHNVAGANDFERSLTGVDITNATTDAFDLINERPIPTTAVDFINGIAPPNATDYVEWAYEDSIQTVAPRAVEAILVVHDAGGSGTNSYTVTLRDSGGGTTANIFSGTQNFGATITQRRAHFATIPGAGAWTLTAFNALRSRFLVSDASPDPYIDAAMLEAEYPYVSLPPIQRPWSRWPLRRGMR